MQEYRRLLIHELNQRKKKNSLYSLRSFARFLEISPSLLSLLISGKKNLTRKQAQKIADKLSLSPLEARKMLGSTLIHELDFVTPSNLRTLKDDEFSLISEWHHLAILSLSEVKGSSRDIKWIAKKLGITVFQANEAFDRLKRLGLIEIKGEGYIQSSPITTTTDVASSAIRKYHKQNLDLAKQKIENVDVYQRSFSSVTMAINPSKLEKAKKMIEEFKTQLCKELERGEKTEVYTLAIQLFPNTSKGENL